jgi:peptidoglycan/LPS O-acetylase OafA/YrhL
MPAGVGLALDVAFVLVFAAVGRASHDEENVIWGVLGTAWPFLAGTAAAWAAVRLLSHRWPLSVGPGISVVVGTVALGMLLRALTGQGTAWTFVVVATLVLAVLLLGWRLLVARVR